ncbi:MAG: response regulator [Bacillota bacterium]|nr:response regulator [Bacillota bacterium]
MKSKGVVRRRPFYIVLIAAAVILILSTVLWMKNTQSASDKTINDLGQFYLEEISERNIKNITSELEKRTQQMETALTVLDSEYLENTKTLQQFISMVKQVNGLDMFAMVDSKGMVYTADSAFSGISRFGFLSDKITEKQIHIVKSYGTNTMVIIAVPVSYVTSSGTRIVSCFTGVRIENVISAQQLENPDNKTYCKLYNREGVSLFNTQDDSTGNLNFFEYLEKNADFAEGYNIETLKKNWDNGGEGYTVFSSENGSHTYVYYKTVPGTALVFTALMNESNINEVVSDGTKRMRWSSVIYLGIVIIFLLSLFCTIIVVLQKSRKKQMENEQFKIVGALSNDYSDIFLMSPVEDISLPIKVNGEMKDYADDKQRPYNETWKNYIDKYVYEEDAEKLREGVLPENLCASLHDQSEYSLDYRAMIDGAIHYFQVKFVKLSGDDDRVIAGVRNIDVQVNAENERQKLLQNALAAAQHANRAKTTFLNNMSHDIRTPMNAIIGFTSLAAAHMDNPEQVSAYLTKIQTASSHLMSLINDVLDMSRIESGKVKLEESPVHLPDVIHDLRTIVQTDIGSKQLDFFIDTVDVINEDIICDRLRLNQILLNLLSNAMKFTEPGGTVGLRIIQTNDQRKGYAGYEFRIKDSGIGMSSEFKEHIFEAFTRERSSTVSGIQGTGLGMAITKSIVDIMGGTIEVKSEPGKGTEVIVDLSFRICGDSVNHDPIPELQGLRALVADDDANTCMSIASMLSVIGMRSEWTTAGKEAVLRAQFAINQGDEFHAYIIDWLMPDMNGIEVVRRIRRIIGESKPIIILTAYDWSNIEEEAREAGVTAFCSKPMFMSELREILTNPYTSRSEAAEPVIKKALYEGKNLLLVEDNELNQEIASEIFKSMGFNVDIADDGDIAVDKIRNSDPERYDIVFMDVQMPRMDGYEATRQIRSLKNKRLANIPIIAMTANAFEEDRRNSFEAGMNEHIAKPIEATVLTKVLDKILK